MRTFVGISFVLVLLSVACGEDNPLNYDTLAGTYTLKEIRVTNASGFVTLGPPDATGTLVLTTTGDFTMSVSAPTLGLNDTYSAGVYAVEGTSLVFEDQDSLGVTGADASVSGNELTLTSAIGNQAVTMIFAKV